MNNAEVNFIYQVQILFTNNSQLPKIPLINTFLEALEAIDKAVSHVFGLEIYQNQILEDMGPKFFTTEFLQFLNTQHN